MALSLRHWLAGTALACAVVAVAQLPPREPPRATFGPPERNFSPERRRVMRIDVELRAARRQLGRAESRTELLRAVRAAAPRRGAAPLLITNLPLAPVTRRAIEEQLAVIWREIGPVSGDIAVGVVVNDQGLLMQVLPPATDGHLCAVALPVEWSLRWIARSADAPRPDQLLPWLRNGLGPCGFYAAFGRPGPQMERWLLGRGFDLGYDMDWLGPRGLERGFDQSVVIGPALRFRPFWEPDDRYQASLDAVACNAWDLARCHAALFAPDTTMVGREMRSDPPGVVVRPWWRSRGTMYRGSHYLADLIHDVGRERFQAFWRSAAPVDSAFFAAMDTPIEVWTARWQRESMGVLRVGSAIRPLSVLLSLLAVGLCVTAGAFLAGRRQSS